MDELVKSLDCKSSSFRIASSNLASLNYMFDVFND